MLPKTPKYYFTRRIVDFSWKCHDDQTWIAKDHFNQYMASHQGHQYFFINKWGPFNSHKVYKQNDSGKKSDAYHVSILYHLSQPPFFGCAA